MIRTLFAVLAVAAPLTLSACSDADPAPRAAAAAEAAPATAEERRILDRAEEGYEDFVDDEADALLASTRRFAAAVRAGDDDRARTLYPRARTHWERIETIAESFGDLDPRLDAREADLAQGETWTGWHRLEKDLWPSRAEAYEPLTEDETDELADQLVADTEDLVDRIDELDLAAGDIVSGSQGLMEEVATGKITGEEEFWSRTDLYDVQANLDGARTGFEQLRPFVENRDADLAVTLAQRFEDLQSVLDRHRDGFGFVGYDALSPEQVKQLATATNAVAEPLAGLDALVPA